jgi:hypothetical protein
MLLHIIASCRGELSHRGRAGRAALVRLLAQCPALSVIERDLGRHPVAHPDARFVEASSMPPDRRSGAQGAALALSDALIDELAKGGNRAWTVCCEIASQGSPAERRDDADPFRRADVERAANGRSR